jgi:hypothetical protein
MLVSSNSNITKSRRPGNSYSDVLTPDIFRRVKSGNERSQLISELNLACSAANLAHTCTLKYECHDGKLSMAQFLVSPLIALNSH